jgi:hypothetical protein
MRVRKAINTQITATAHLGSVKNRFFVHCTLEIKQPDADVVEKMIHPKPKISGNKYHLTRIL